MKPCRTAPFVLMAPQQMQVIPVAAAEAPEVFAAAGSTMAGGGGPGGP
jgi:hypothetical protein